jgi:hypothetical protein
MIIVNINLAQVEESLLYEGKTAFFLQLNLTENLDKDGKSIVVQGVSRDDYYKGVRGKPCGTWCDFGSKSSTSLKKRDFDLCKYMQSKPADFESSEEMPSDEME